MIQLRPMSDAEFDAYLEQLIPKYAREGARATGMLPEEALKFARNQISRLLPDGRRTTDHHFITVVDDCGDTAGILWFAERLDRDPPDVFIYDIVIEESRRGRGFGSASMRALEEEVARIPLNAISLHVFSTNQSAIRLYERLGYECTHRGDGGLQMTKRLQPRP